MALGSYYKNGVWKAGLDHVDQQQRINHLKDYHACIQEAEKVVIVGAGFTGCEAAGEIKSKYPGKDVALIGRVLKDAPERTQDRVRAISIRDGSRRNRSPA